MINVEELLGNDVKRLVSNFSNLKLESDYWNILSKKKKLGKRVIEMKMLKEVIQILSRKKFQNVTRGEIRVKNFKNTLFYYIIFFREDVLAFASVINVFEMGKNIDKSNGNIHAIRYQFKNKDEIIDYEQAYFNNYGLEVRNHIEIIGNLYRKIRRL